MENKEGEMDLIVKVRHAFHQGALFYIKQTKAYSSVDPLIQTRILTNRLGTYVFSSDWSGEKVGICGTVLVYHRVITE